MKARIKICGITNLDDALAAVDFGTDAIGFVFYKNSPRFIPVDTAAAIIGKLPPFITTVGVFVNENAETIKEVRDSAGIDMVQLHGEEPPGMCTALPRLIKAIRVKSLSSLEPLLGYKNMVSAFLLDTFTEDVFGGTGQIFNWDIAVEAKQFGRIILAGGLNPDNIADAVKRVRPYGVDVSSGVESGKGRKDHEKMQLFIERAKAA